MFGWAASHPRYCLKFGAESVAWAETERNWRGRRQHRCVLSPVPDGAVKPSPVELNLSHLPALEGCIKELAGPGPDLRIAGRVLVPAVPRPVRVLLPDAAVRAVVLHLEHLPSQREEREALIRWRLGQEQLLPLAGAHVVSQVFQGSAEDGSWHSVLAVAIQESVLDQYESLCASLGLIPQAVGITSLQLFELWRRAVGPSRWQRRDFLWANVADKALTTMVFQQGRLLFYRCKLLGGESALASPSSAVLEKIVGECGASLDACRQRHPRAFIEEAVLCVDGHLSALHAEMETGLDLFVEHIGWAAVEALGCVTKDSHRGMASLAAMAGVS